MLEDEISAVVSQYEIPDAKLNEAQRSALVEELGRRFDVNMLMPSAPWDVEGKNSGKFDPDGWKKVAEYVGKNECFLMSGAAESVWRISSGPNLFCILNESTGFEFYVCNPDLTYLICYNHHDYIIGWGNAKNWVDRLT